MLHFFLKNVDKNNEAVHLRLVLTCLFKTFFNAKKHLAWALKKICLFIFLCIPNKVKKKQSTFFVHYHNGLEMYKSY